ncbi:MAG: diaminopimelate epimerase [Candidatus Omnitrophica bacterium]|nr:diaminopimelate epimerase [Candidatus Omnitrophota bacterium]
MKSLHFAKIVAAGNDFVVVEKKEGAALSGLKKLAQKMCDRIYGIGADGLLLLEKSRKADVKMRVFNADGSEAEMCGNGARCVALYCLRRKGSTRTSSRVTIETRAGLVDSLVRGDLTRIMLTEPKDIEFGIPVHVRMRNLRVDYIDTGVPHAVLFVEDLSGVAVDNVGSAIRHHERFSPRGTNVNFVEIRTADTIMVRTYERGVEAETLACGTGSAAAALIFALKTNAPSPVKVKTAGGEVLKIYWRRSQDKLSDVWLEGKARIVYKGAYYV